MDFHGKCILILGYGISGKGAAELAQYLGATAIPVDTKKPDDVTPGIFGWTPETQLPSADLAVISPGIPADSPMAQAVKAKGIRLIGELEFAYLANSCRIAAITGTNGKTTTTELTTALLRANGVRAEAAGNIGNSLSSSVRDVLEKRNLDTLVVEVSSFQLETVDTFAPSTAAWLNLASDHINRHGSMENYAQTKANLFRRMKNGSAILNASLPKRYLAEIRKNCSVTTFSASANADFQLDGNRITYQGKMILSTDDLSLKGAHNVENAMAALAILKGEAGEDFIFSKETIETLKNFRPDVHRMEFFAEKNGIRFVDDSKATNPHSVNAALKTFGGKKNVILILGGSDKDMDFSSIAEDADKVKCAFLIGQTARKIQNALSGAFECTLCDSLEDAVTQSYSAAVAGDIVAMSPACASFDMFRDYKDRGDKFKKAVLSL